MNTVRIKKTATTALQILAVLAAIGVFSALIAWGRAEQSIAVNGERIDGMEPRLLRIEREVSAMAAKQDLIHEDVREISRFIVGARRERDR
jgi:hypothetical protein